MSIFKLILNAEDRSDAAFNSVSNRMRSIGDSATGLAAALGVSFSGVAFAALIKGSIDAADEISKLSQKTGTTVESLVGLKYAADQNGASLDSVARAGQKLSQMMADKPDLFNRIGVTAQDSTTAMVQLADTFADMPDGVEKSALATKIFGDRLSAEMIPFLNQGTQALQGYIEQGQKLNPLTAESAKQAELFNDNLDTLKAAAAGLGMTMAMDVLKPLTQITDAMRDAATESGLLKAAWVGLGGVGVALFTDDMLSRAQQLEKQVKQLTTQIEMAEGMVGNVTPISAPLRQQREALEQELKLVKEADDKLAEQAAFQKKLKKFMADEGDGGAAAKNLYKGLAGNTEAQKAAAQAAKDREDFLNFEIEQATKEQEANREVFYAGQVAMADIRTAALEERQAQEQAYHDWEYNLYLDSFNRKIELQAESNAAIAGMLLEGQLTMEDLEAMSWERKTGMAISGMGQLLSAVGNHNKGMFEAGKVFARADAVINMYQGVAAGVKLGWPLAIPAVAFALAQGGMALSKINSQQFGGGSSTASAPATSGIYGSNPIPSYGTIPTAPGSSLAPQIAPPKQEIKLSLSGMSTLRAGDLVDATLVRDKLLPEFVSALKDGVGGANITLVYT